MPRFADRPLTSARTARRRRGAPGDGPPARFEPLERRALLSAGDLDPTFAGDGIVDYQNYQGLALDVLLHENGKVLVSGWLTGHDSAAGVAQYGIARYNPDGTPDLSFGDRGLVETGLGYIYSGGAAVAPDGKIVVAGQPADPMLQARYDLLVERSYPDGTLDTTFGDHGQALADFPDRNYAQDAVVAADGSITLAGWTNAGYAAPTNAALFRFTAAGAPDVAFGAGGRSVYNLGPNDSFTSLALDGSAVFAAGAVETRPGDSAALLARFTASGALDPSFSGDGFVVEDLGPTYDSAADVALQPDGRVVIVASGSTSTESFDAYVARYTPGGAADASFGTGGKVAVNFGTSRNLFNAVGLMPDGRIVAGGYTFPYPNARRAAFARLMPDGSFDPSFDGDGKAVIPNPPPLPFRDEQAAIANAMAVLPNGSIYYAGTDAVDAFPFNPARLTPAGQLDPAFGHGGRGLSRVQVSAHTSPFSTPAANVVVQADNTVVFAGVGYPSRAANELANGGFYLTRRNADGSLDTTFGDRGDVLTSYAGRDLNLKELIALPGGKLLAGGSASGVPDTTSDFAVARYNADGSPDASFGNGGLVLTDFATYDRLNDVAVDRNGKILAAGGTGGRFGEDLTVARYNPDGSLDTTFGAGGRAVHADLGTATYVIPLPDGTMLVGNYGQIVRLRADGSIDPTFHAIELPSPENEDGEALDHDEIYDVEVLPDGRFVTAGGFINNLTDDDLDYYDYAIMLARYNADGTPDTTFGTGGRVQQRFDEAQSVIANALSVQADGKLVVGGTDRPGEAETNSYLARFNPDGSLDSSFGLDGKTFTGRTDLNVEGWPPDPGTPVMDIALAPDGKIVTAGGGFWGGYEIRRYVAASNAAGDTTFDVDTGILLVRGTAGDDALRVSANRVRLTVSGAGATRSFPTRFVRRVIVYGRDGNDSIVLNGGVPRVIAYGGAGNDSLVGGDGADALYGQGGDDTLDGGSGSDLLSGADGTDTVTYASRTRPVTIRLNQYETSGEQGEADRLSDVDMARGGAGNDTLTATYASRGVALYGGPGDDTITGGAYDDALWGEDGNDTLVNTYGADYFRGGPGIDTVTYADSSMPVTADIDPVTGDDGKPGEGDTVYSDNENLTGGGGNDRLTGSRFDNVLRGGDGDDTLIGLDGDDALWGGPGNNTYDGGPGNDTINGVPESPAQALATQSVWSQVNPAPARTAGNRPRRSAYGADLVAVK
jgi:uncharacterized delta-60 repeat protein